MSAFLFFKYFFLKYIMSVPGCPQQHLAAELRHVRERVAPVQRCGDDSRLLLECNDLRPGIRLARTPQFRLHPLMQRTDVDMSIKLETQERGEERGGKTER